GSLKNILTELGKQSGYDFFYDSEALDHAKPISLHLQHVSLEEALEACFKNQPLQYVIEGRSVVIKKKENVKTTPTNPPFVNQKPVKGKVMGVNGAPLEGASVQIKGSGMTTRTDANGAFVFQNVPNDAVLLISYV